MHLTRKRMRFIHTIISTTTYTHGIHAILWVGDFACSIMVVVHIHFRFAPVKELPIFAQLHLARQQRHSKEPLILQCGDCSAKENFNTTLKRRKEYRKYLHPDNDETYLCQRCTELRTGTGKNEKIGLESYTLARHFIPPRFSILSH